MTTPVDPERLQRQVRSLRLFAFITALIALLALWLAWGSTNRGAVAASLPRSIVVNELAVVDSAGVVRARLTGNVPDAVIKGRTAPRGGRSAGLVIYDATGQERGGYVTFDDPQANALLTLDTRNGQVAYFVADAEHGVALKLWTAGNLIELRADSSAARITGTRDGGVILQQPPLAEAEVTDLCEGLRAELAAIKDMPPFTVLLDACKQRMSEEQCRVCLEPWAK